MVSFAAEASVPGSTRMEVRAVLDGRIVAAPGAAIFSEDDGDGLRARSFDFVFPSAASGKHTVEIACRNSDEDGVVTTDFPACVVYGRRIQNGYNYKRHRATTLPDKGE